MSQRKRILIVDDEVTIADSLASIFAAREYESKAVYSAEGAFQAVTDWLPDLAIIDVQLKRVDGVDLAIRLQEKIPGCELAFFSGLFSLDGHIEKAIEAGLSFELIAKPMSPEEMLRFAAQKLSANGSRHPAGS